MDKPDFRIPTEAQLRGSPEVQAECAERRAKGERCHSGRDGECNDRRCPQNRDGEPMKSGRHCPLDKRNEDEDG